MTTYLCVVAESDGEKLLFVTECKGTTPRRGLARNDEGKMLYQLARTFAKVRSSEGSARSSVGGIVSVVVNYHSWAITINVCGSDTAMAGGLPDPWMYPGRDPSML